MKKLIALILILAISSFIIVSTETTPMTPEMTIEKSLKSNLKNKNWEYVKDRLFDGETENVYKLEGPILLFLNKASKQDSMAVEEIMQELRSILPHKTIDYFNKYTGLQYDNLPQSWDHDTKVKGGFLHKLVSNTIKINFVNSIPNFPMDLISRIGDDNEIERSMFQERWKSVFDNEKMIIFSFNKSITYERRKRIIQYEIYRMLCYIDPVKPLLFGVDDGVFETSFYLPDQARFKPSDKFLLQKLYSDNFKEQFKDYIYTNYPWRYASSFINKKEHLFKVYCVLIGLGALVLILALGYFQNRKYKYVYLNYLFPTFLIILHFINLCNIYNYLTDFNSTIGWDSAIVVNIKYAFAGSVLISFVLWGLESVSFRRNESFSYQLLLKVIFTFLSFLVPILLMLVLHPELGEHLDLLFPYIFFSAGLAIGRGLLLYLNHFSESLVKEKDVELSRLKGAKAQAEVKVLQSQINPHFLYNALNSIASLAHTDADKTEKMALSLSDLFRHAINRKGEKVNSLQDEVNLVRNYFEIEQIRFGERLKFSIDIEPDLLAVEIPMFMLQPLVENTIKHGVSKIEGFGSIVLKINKKDKGILISVQDNGPDFSEGLVSGHGLQTVYDLLRFSYGDKAEISWHNQPEKKIMIHITDIL